MPEHRSSHSNVAVYCDNYVICIWNARNQMGHMKVSGEGGGFVFYIKGKCWGGVI